jgi:hypothetical protein
VMTRDVSTWCQHDALVDALLTYIMHMLVYCVGSPCGQLHESIALLLADVEQSQCRTNGKND